ncbi:MAG: DDE-type integrase/transposase/recombinase [Pyrinomonadaceae bacterium]
MKHNSSPFKWRHFEPSLILLCVRWYCRYQLSYRDVEEMMRERGFDMDHSTVFRWVQRYAPEINKRIRPHLKTSGTSFRVDETYNLNDVIEQDHRFVKKKVQASQCFKSFHTAERTLEGIEAVNMMRNGQVKRLAGSDAQGQAKFVASLFGVAA